MAFSAVRCKGGLALVVETKAVDAVRVARRAAARAVQRIDAGEISEREIDFARVLFGETAAEEKLAAIGLLDHGGICDALEARVHLSLYMDFEELGKVNELAAHLEARFKQVREERAEKAEADLPNGLLRKVAAPGREDVAARNAERSRKANARILAVHLLQRSMYQAMSRVFAELVREQSAGQLAADQMHGPIAMGERHVLAADAAIERLRKAHLAGEPSCGDVPWEVVVGPRRLARRDGEPTGFGDGDCVQPPEP